MKQSSLQGSVTSGLHVAMIMDGNGRWATARGLPRVAGHRAGVETVRKMVEAAPNLGISILTLYAFSSDNWKRPQAEVSTLMRLFRVYLRSEAEKCRKHGIQIEIIGRRDRLSPQIQAAISKAEAITAGGKNLRVRLAVDYSSRDAILWAAQKIKPNQPMTREEFSQLLAEVHHGYGPAPDVDLLIRTGGEQRLSDYLLWENAYAELHFTKRMWPDFDKADLEIALNDYYSRERRFGQVLEVAAS